MRAFAACAAAALTEAMTMVPSSRMSICVPVSLVIAWIVEPPLPITSRILSGWIFDGQQARRVLSASRGAVMALPSRRGCACGPLRLRQRDLHDLPVMP